jgi:hypothetical protein
MTEDQMYIPEDVRHYPSEKNPHCHSYIWRPQEDLDKEDKMRDPEWYPKGTHYNVYNRKDFRRETDNTPKEY